MYLSYFDQIEKSIRASSQNVVYCTVWLELFVDSVLQIMNSSLGLALPNSQTGSREFGVR